jgi:Cytochrome c/c1 heme lyase
MVDQYQHPKTAATSSDEKNVVASLEEAARHAQTPQPDQRFPLRTDRQVSSIPRGSATVVMKNAILSDAQQAQQPPAVQQQLPHHQATVPHDEDANDVTTLHWSKNNSTKNQHWIYPSEQQLYNAMRRKGWQNVPIDSIPTVLQIHNSINERTWDKVLEWEYMMMNDGSRPVVGNSNFHRLVGLNKDDNNTLDDGNDDPTSSNHESTPPPPTPRLVRFEGRPKDMTPKAYLFSNILRLSDPPFDRHDWYVESGTSSSSTAIVQRYVIDYYMMEQHDPFSVPIPYVDARPAVDSPRAVWMRTRRFLQDAFPGITSYYRRHYGHQSQWQSSSSPLIQQQQPVEQQQQQAPQK